MVGLDETRGTTFGPDEYWYFVANRGFRIKALLFPHNGNLIAVVRLIYATVFTLHGAGYLPFRLLQVFGIALNAVLLYVLVRRRVGSAMALAPSVLLLFLGSSSDTTLTPNGITHVYCVASGLGALLALEQGSRRRDLIACALLTVSVATFSIGLAFVAGVAVAILMQSGRARRAWIFVVPLVVYGLWALASAHFTGPTRLGGAHVALANALLIPSFVANAAAAVMAATFGLGWDFSGSGGPAGTLTNYTWGTVIVAIAVGLFVLGLRRGRLRRTFWSFLTIPLFIWVSVVMVLGVNRYPNSTRFIYAAAIGLVLAAAEALRGVRLSRRGLLVLFGSTAFALVTNIAQLRAAGNYFRAIAPPVRAALAGIQLAGNHVSTTFTPSDPGIAALVNTGGGAGAYVQAVRRNGSSPAFSVSKLRSQPESVREEADSTLVAALGIGMSPASAPGRGVRCLRIRGRGLQPNEITIGPPGVILRSSSAGGVKLGRFGSAPSVVVGILPPDRYTGLPIPQDRAPGPWHASLPAGLLTVCPLE